MDFFQPATDATCSLPSRKPAAAVGGRIKARKTRRARKVAAGGIKKRRGVTHRHRAAPKRKLNRRATRKTMQHRRK